jgi:N-carbamoylputrescine amidase
MSPRKRSSPRRAKPKPRAAAPSAPATGAPFPILRVALVQMKADGNPERNLSRAIDYAAAAAKKGARLVVLQELFRSPYFCFEENHDWFRLAETIPGPSTEALGAVAKEHGIVIVAPLFERRAAGIYHNSAAVIDADGSVVDTYRKMHIPDDPGYFEKFYFSPGDLGFKATRTAAGTLGTLICWDQWFPEAARLTAMAGADLLLYPTAIGGIPKDSREDHATQADAWETTQRAHAIANGNFVLAVNRVGVENGVRFWGGSFVCDPLGKVIARAGRDRDEVLVVDLDLRRVEYARQHWPFLRDRRIDAYIGIIRRWGE